MDFCLFFMERKIAIGLFAVIFSLFLVSNVSAFSWKSMILLNTIEQKSNDYDIFWEGPYKGGKLSVSFNGGKSQPLVSSEILSGNDYVKYTRNNVRKYDSSGNSGYGLYGNSRTNSFRDSSESIVIDNRGTSIQALRSGENVRVAEINAISRIRTSEIDANRAVEMNQIDYERDVRLAIIQADENVRLKELDVVQSDIENTHPYYDPVLGYYNWRY